MKVLVDAQLPPALAALLAEHGHEAEHVGEVDLMKATDSAIWDYALRHDAVVITKDEDFPHRLSQGGVGPVVIWLRIGNTSRRALLEWFEPLLPEIDRFVAQGDRLIEVR